MKKLRGYIFSRPFIGERVPQQVQNLVIREYCSINSFQYLLSLVEYRFENSSLMLMQALNQLNKIDGIVFYSLLQLPFDDKQRLNVYKKIFKSKKELHFALEGMKINKKVNFESVENIFLIKKTLPKCLINLKRINYNEKA